LRDEKRRVLANKHEGVKRLPMREEEPTTSLKPVIKEEKFAKAEFDW
jgi:hypothetical protein